MVRAIPLKKQEGEKMAFLSEGVKSPCPRGVLKILVFVLGVKNCKLLSEGGKEKSQFCPRGSLRISSPSCFFNGIALNAQSILCTKPT